jgi:peptidyl-prolyl cis-trans isomerase C
MINLRSTLFEIVSIPAKNKFLVLCIVSLHLTIFSDVRATNLEPDPVVAKIKDFKIYKSDIERARKQLSTEAQQYPNAAVYELLLKSLIDTHLVAEAARKRDLDKGSEIVKQMRRIADQFLYQAYLDARIAGAVTDKKLKKLYQTSIKSSLAKEEIRARHILVQTREQANEVIRQLNDGADFSDLAKKISTGPSGKQGGNLGYFTRERMVPAFSEGAFATSVGKFTEEPVKTQFGWHVIKVEDKRIVKPKPFDQVKMRLRKKMTNDLVDSIIIDLRRGVKIEIFGPDGK